MKKIAFLLLASLTIGIYYYWEVGLLHIAELLQDRVAYVAIKNDLPLQVQIVEPINLREKDVVPHKQLYSNGILCSNCHQSLKNNELLRTDSCTSCHDGTLGFYNVNESLFHKKPELPGQPQQEWEKADDRALTCSDCHNLHGSYSDRLLHNNPFHTATETPENGGYLAKGKVYDYSELIDTHNAFKASFIGGSNAGVWFTRKDGGVENDPNLPIFMLVRGSTEQLGLLSEGVPANATAIIVYQYMERPATPTIPYRRGYFIPAKLSWLYGYNYEVGQKQYWTRFFGEDETSIDHLSKNVIFNYPKGFVYATDSTLDSVTSGEVAQSHSVELEKTEIAAQVYQTNLEGLNQFNLDQKSIETSKGARLGRLGVEITKFCTSCHLSYLGGGTLGKFSFAHQNFSDYNKWNCLKCHYGHESVKEKGKSS